MNRLLRDVLDATGGVVSCTIFPELRGPVTVAARKKALVNVLPSVYVHADLRGDWRAFAVAAMLWHPDAVITGRAAAALGAWAEAGPRTIEVANVRTALLRPGFTFTSRPVPPELTTVRDGIRYTSPALTALDLAPETDGNSIDDVLRAKAATLHGMRRALDLTPGRIGNTDRRRLLFDSRGNPWSRGERMAHHHLYAAGITGWITNSPIVCDGYQFYLDLDFLNCPLVAEIDGAGHLKPEQFEHDLWRRNLITLHGRTMMNFTMSQVRDGSEFIRSIRRGLDQYR